MPDVVPGATRPLVRISCPDCDGVLEARADGPRRHLTFICRVQHTFSVVDLLGGKEDQLDTRLWSSLNLAEELGELLMDLADRASDQGLDMAAAALRDRADHALALTGSLRRLIDDNRAVEVSDDVSRIHAGEAR